MGAVLKRWDGSAWQTPTAVNVWNGSAWVAGVPNVWDGTQWQSGGGVVPPPSPPQFVDVAYSYNNGLTGSLDFVATKPGGTTLVAMLTWNATSAFDKIPAGWTQVDSAAGSSSGAAVFTADSSVTDMTWSFTVAAKVSAVVLGYTKGVVVGHANGVRSSSVTTATAPTITVASADAPARIVRLFWEKSTVATTATVTGATKEGPGQFATTAGNSAVGADAILSAAGATGTAVATYDGPGSAQGGGFTVVLSSKSLQ